MLDFGAKVNETNDEGVTALMNVAAHNKAEVVRFRLTVGADPDQRDKSGQTALMWAIRTGSSDAARLLEKS